MNRKQRRVAGKQGGNGAGGSGRPPSFGHRNPLFIQALRHFQAGRLPEAEADVRQCLAVDPDNVDGLHLLGLIAARVGRYDAAVGLIGKAVALRPDFAEAHYNLGRAYRDLGAINEAATCYRRALAVRPDFAEAHMNLGNALSEMNKPDEAVACHRRAVALRPDLAEAHYNLGRAYLDQGRPDDAASSYRRALALKPDFAEAHYNLGCAYRDLGAIDEAAACYRRALAVKPDYADAHTNLGNALSEMNEPDEAVACHRRALAIRPDFAEAHYNLGRVYLDQGRPEDAASSFRRALMIKPDYAEAQTNLGNALSEMNELDEAEACHRRAIAVRPDFAEAHYNLGRVYLDQGRPEDAASSCRRALMIKPDYAEAHTNLGYALLEMNELEEAVACCQRALDIRPDLAEAHYNMGLGLERLKRLDEAAGALRRALTIKPDYPEALSVLTFLRQRICDWEGLEAEVARTVDLASHAAAAIPPFVILAQSSSPELQLACARRYAEKKYARIERRFAHTAPVAERRIRLGYLSPDFRVHPVAYCTAELFERHDRARFEIFGYSLGSDDDSEMRRRLKKGFDRFVDLRSLSDAEAAARIHADGIDILVDLAGYTADANTKILAARPAPIQVNWLGYAGTMGADFMDYIIVDAFAVPPEHQPFFTETLVHLPHCFMPSDTTRRIAETIPTRAECGLPEEAFVFCCFNNSYKIMPRFFALCMGLLAAVPGSVLWLRGDETVKRNLSREAGARGIDPARLVFAPLVPMDEHLARYRQADLFLDTLPYNAHATTSDALWAGLPVLTQAGTCFPGRVAGSLLHAVGLPELVTASEEEYQALALRLAREPELLGHYRQRLAANRTTAPLFDAAGFARDIEAAYERMWQHWRDGEPAASFQTGIR